MDFDNVICKFAICKFGASFAWGFSKVFLEKVKTIEVCRLINSFKIVFQGRCHLDFDICIKSRSLELAWLKSVIRTLIAKTFINIDVKINCWPIK